jgi:RNA 3'-terminal phosphate cyclase (ATP)
MDHVNMGPRIIDGSAGEGGGQMLRTALGLSVATGIPFRMERIRAGRERPGLLRQHLAGVRLLAALSRARATGAELGSTTLEFDPTTRAVPGDYTEAVGTAGSALLVLQAALPALLTADGPIRLVISGGTHNSGAPPFEHTARVLIPLLTRMGARVAVALERHGFYPAGGGRIVVTSEPAPLTPLDCRIRGAPTHTEARAIVSGLPPNIGHRELQALRTQLGLVREQLVFEDVPSPVGPGNAAMVVVHTEHATEVFTGFGERGRSSEAVADDVGEQTARWLAADVPVAEHTADQLLVPMGLAGAGRFRTGPLSRHATTNIAVMRQFLAVEVDVLDAAGGAVEVIVRRA